MKPLKLCMVTTFYPPFSFGGDGIFVYQLAHALAEKGHRVDVIHSEDAYRLQHPSTAISKQGMAKGIFCTFSPKGKDARL